MSEKYLPIGTVVMLKNGEKKLMINGYCAVDSEEPNRVYDYSGVMFPEGLLTYEQTLIFNHSDIDKIYHMGLIDMDNQIILKN